jgi:hypothetical protein
VKRYRHEDVKTPLECLAQLAAAELVTFKAGATLAALFHLQLKTLIIWRCSD